MEADEETQSSTEVPHISGAHRAFLLCMTGKAEMCRRWIALPVKSLRAFLRFQSINDSRAGVDLDGGFSGM